LEGSRVVVAQCRFVFHECDDFFHLGQNGLCRGADSLATRARSQAPATIDHNLPANRRYALQIHLKTSAEMQSSRSQERPMFSDHVLSSSTVRPATSSRLTDSVRQDRREKAWAWLTLFTLILCWDASLRLDERVSPPRVRIAHIGEAADVESVAIKRR
jgi:hypothetical protein